MSQHTALGHLYPARTNGDYQRHWQAVYSNVVSHGCLNDNASEYISWLMFKSYGSQKIKVNTYILLLINKSK